MGRRLLLGVGLAVALGAAPALADEAPPPKSATPPKIATQSTTNKRPLVHRPVVVGLLAAVFLIIGAAAGANDKKS
jgi:hypothetical protein